MNHILTTEKIRDIIEKARQRFLKEETEILRKSGFIKQIKNGMCYYLAREIRENCDIGITPINNIELFIPKFKPENLTNAIYAPELTEFWFTKRTDLAITIRDNAFKELLSFY